MACGLYMRFVLIWSRGTGKSTVIAEYLIRCIETMPRSRGWLAAHTIDRVKNFSLPSIQEHWERMGLIEDVHYVIDKVPPKHWKRPINKIKNFRNTIAFRNGCVIDLLSCYAEGAGRGGNYQFGAADEAGMIKRENLIPSVTPAMRGLGYKVSRLKRRKPKKQPWGKIIEKGLSFIWKFRWRECPYYMTTLFVTSMPYLDRGRWVLDMEGKEDVWFQEATCFENLEVLGEDYPERMKRELSPFTYKLEILNERMRLTEHAFYPKFNEKQHVTIIDYYRPDMHLDLSFDFGGFCCMVIGQVYGERAHAERFLYYNEAEIDDLINLFLDEYKEHLHKHVRIFGDVNGRTGTKDDKRNQYERVQAKLIRAGWTYEMHVPVYNPLHADKYQLMNALLSQQDTAMLPVDFHDEGCKDLIISVKMAPRKGNSEKDKKSEHQNSGVEQQHATHGSDALDYWLIELSKSEFRQDLTASGSELVF